MINFIGSPAQTGHAGTDKNITTIHQKTGYEGDKDILKNIYDLEGNNVEWTAQADNTLNRVYRGGGYLNALWYLYPASYRSSGSYSYYPSNGSLDCTTRLSLYL